jgi:hypothetical protein
MDNPLSKGSPSRHDESRDFRDLLLIVPLG